MKRAARASKRSAAVVRSSRPARRKGARRPAFARAASRPEVGAPDAGAFRDALSHCASGVTVVTTAVGGVRHGLTVSAFCSVSAAPPRVLVCLANENDSTPLVRRSGCLAVHVLGQAGAALGIRFAKLVPDGGELFAGLATTVARSGAPILDDCVVWFDCRVAARYRVGDHTIFVGDVLALGRGRDTSEPVVYSRRAWRQLDARPIDL